MDVQIIKPPLYVDQFKATKAQKENVHFSLDISKSNPNSRNAQILDQRIHHIFHTTFQNVDITLN